VVADSLWGFGLLSGSWCHGDRVVLGLDVHCQCYGRGVLMLTEQRYICEECGFVGTASEFEGHLVSKGYNYGHNDCAPDEYELQCPSCSMWEQDGISEASSCGYGSIQR
jgi:hypothetical protein